MRAASTVSTAGCDLGLAQLLLGRGGVVVGLVGEHEVAERSTVEERPHDLVGLVEGAGHDGLDLAQVGEHVHVLRALAGEEESGRGRGAAAPEHPAPPQHLPGRGHALGDGVEGPLGPVGELGGVAVVDGDALGCPQVGVGGRLDRWGAADLGLGSDLPEPFDQAGLVGRADHQRAPQRRLGLGHGRRRRGRRRRGARRGEVGTHRHHLAAGARQASGLVLFEHRVEVRPAEAEGADAGDSAAVVSAHSRSSVLTATVWPGSRCWARRS